MAAVLRQYPVCGSCLDADLPGDVVSGCVCFCLHRLQGERGAIQPGPQRDDDPRCDDADPELLIIRTLGWYDTFYALIIPFAASVFGIFLLRQYFMSMPKELWEAAQIDGASRLRYFRALLCAREARDRDHRHHSFLGAWTSFLWPTVMTQSQNKQLIEVALNSFLGEKGQQWSQLAAASVFTTIPIVILFFFVQRQFIEGIGGGGIKG